MFVTIICFKIKNPPTLHSTSKIQPTTSPTFVFSMFESVKKTWGYEIKLLTVVLVVKSIQKSKNHQRRIFLDNCYRQRCLV
jgi:hypothetical protein